MWTLGLVGVVLLILGGFAWTCYIANRKPRKSNQGYLTGKTDKSGVYHLSSSSDSPPPSGPAFDRFPKRPKPIASSGAAANSIPQEKETSVTARR